MRVSVFCCVFVFLLGVVRVRSATCPDGWSPHEEYCFLFKKETYTWFDAKTVCEALGGYLAEDTSGSRHQFLNGLVQSHGYTSGFTWIGLTDFVEENVFKWAHGGFQADPTFWGPGEPQDWHGEEDCVMLKYGLWNDLNCEDNRPHFICERQAIADEVVG